MAIITYIVEARRYDGVPAELACDEVERKAFKYPCRTPSSMFDFRRRRRRRHHWRRGAALPSTSKDGDKLHSYTTLIMIISCN